MSYFDDEDDLENEASACRCKPTLDLLVLLGLLSLIGIGVAIGRLLN
jgi:hypothetical protein